MTRLSSADLRGALVAAGTWHQAATLPELETAAIGALHRLIPCDGVGWNEVDVSRREVRIMTSPVDYFDDGHEALDRLIDQNPIVDYVSRTGDQSATKFSDHLNVRGYHRLEIYTDFYRSVHVEDQLAVLVDAHPLMIGIAFNRSRRSFTERDRTLLNLLRPHLVAAYRNALDRLDAESRIATLERGLEGRAIVVLDHEGRIADVSPGGSALLTTWFGTVPKSLDPGEYVTDEATLVVRLASGTPQLLLVEEQRRRPDPERVKELGLSRREADIVALAGAGLSDATIAKQLYLSTRTVSKHLQNAYEKLGVHTRREAVALLLRR